MPYIVGKSAIKKECMDVYIRNHDNAGTEAWNTSNGIVDITSATNLYQNDGSDDCDWAGVAASALSSSNTTQFGKLGELAENPFIEITEGDEVALASCDAKLISEKLEAAFTDLQATKEHWEMLRAMAAFGNVDILIVKKGAHLLTSGNAVEGYAFADAPLRVTGKFGGNAQREITVKATKEVDPDNLDTYFKIISVYNAT